MLYDKRWDKTPDPYSLPNLIAWLETMPADRSYVVGNISQCLLAQFGVAMGATNAREISVELGWAYASIAFPVGWKTGDCTFGKALDRGRHSAALMN